MFEAADTTQMKTLVKIFPGYTKDKNAFIGKFDSGAISSTSEKLFGNRYTMQVAAHSIAVKVGVSRLGGKALYFNNSVKVILHTKGIDGTIVEIQKK